MSKDDQVDIEPLTSSVEPPATEPDARSAALRRMVAQLVLDTTNEGIWLIDAQARTTFVNRHTAELLGYTESEMIGQKIFAFMDQTRKPTAEQNLQRRQRGIEEREAVRLQRKDGTPIWVLGSTNPLYDRQGRYAGALALLGDLTEQKATEQHLRDQIEALRARLVKMTIERTERARPPRVVAEEASPFREPFRSAIVLGVCGTFLATVALLTVGGVIHAVLRPGSSAGERPEFG
jgi:PAS domain S-box-containing protein